jgi:hypothetical protein
VTMVVVMIVCADDGDDGSSSGDCFVGDDAGSWFW